MGDLHSGKMELGFSGCVRSIEIGQQGWPLEKAGETLRIFLGGGGLKLAVSTPKFVDRRPPAQRSGSLDARRLIPEILNLGDVWLVSTRRSETLSVPLMSPPLLQKRQASCWKRSEKRELLLTEASRAVIRQTAQRPEHERWPHWCLHDWMAAILRVRSRKVPRLSGTRLSRKLSSPVALSDANFSQPVWHVLCTVRTQTFS